MSPNRFALAIAALLFLDGCPSAPAEPGKLEREATPLAEPFESYLSVEEVRALLPEGTYSLQEYPKPGGGICPRNDAVEISTNWSESGHSGRLVLLFANDKLYWTLFYPDHPSEYLDAVRASGKPIPKDGSAPETLIAPRTRYWFQDWSSSGPYVGWADRAIREEIGAISSDC